ncbi:hypothetical protein [Kitasatospora sp. NPDC093558]|uniref:hypothetical protein n=1 Tax=Kitasatospora sp. NPDC093558 TaxID=3155201 RepID=UPI00344AC008
MAERRYEYAPAGTLPGLLQRGRGLGALMAAEDPAAAAELVYGCVRWEWRWDASVDQRDRYLARLVRDLALPLGPVVELLSAGDAARERAVRVLELLALDGSDEAREALRAHGREDGRGSPEPLAGPGEPPDGRGVPALVAELERCWVEQTWRGPAGLAWELGRFGAEAAGAASLLRRFWLWTPHSSERAAYLEGLAAVGSAGMGEAYTESLWDCEADARLLGVERAPDEPRVRERLVGLRDDPMEETAVREAARARLAGPAWGPSGRAGRESAGELE